MMEPTVFPDGLTPVSNWFNDVYIPNLTELGKKYDATDFGIKADGKLQTAAFQQLIDTIFLEGGGALFVPAGEFLTGALFFKPGVNLYLSKGAILKGSDDISDYPILDTRIEGQSCKYFSALINADGVNGFNICGEGTIDGNGLKAWKAFWQRRLWNPECTNKDEQRARLVYISNSTDVTVSGITIRNSQFWSNHLYKCERVRYVNVTIESPSAPVEAPSTDAIDIDVCSQVHIIGCKMSVNDDAVVLKGGKGINCDKLPENGASSEIIVENCEFGFCHSCITMGSECIHGKNLIVRNCKSYGARDFLRFKMRPDTPQLYEDVLVENIENVTYCFLDIKAWTQFYEGNEETNPKSFIRNVVVNNCTGSCVKFYDVITDERQFNVSDVSIRNVDFSVVTAGITDVVEKCINTCAVELSEDAACEASKLMIDVAKIL